MQLIQQLIAYTNTLKLMLLHQTVITAKLEAQIEEDRKALLLAKETIELLGKALFGKEALNASES